MVLPSECARPRCSLHAARCLLAAAPFPSPPLEERGRERRSLFSAGTLDLSGRQPAGMSPRTAASRMGLLSPALSSKGGEGEPPGRCSPPPDACKVQHPQAQQCWNATKLYRLRGPWAGDLKPAEDIPCSGSPGVRYRHCNCRHEALTRLSSHPARKGRFGTG